MDLIRVPGGSQVTAVRIYGCPNRETHPRRYPLPHRPTQTRLRPYRHCAYCQQPLTIDPRPFSERKRAGVRGIGRHYVLVPYLISEHP